MSGRVHRSVSVLLTGTEVRPRRRSRTTLSIYLGGDDVCMLAS
jgi:hypothetical protein